MKIKGKPNANHMREERTLSMKAFCLNQSADFLCSLGQEFSWLPAKADRDTVSACRLDPHLLYIAPESQW